MAGQRLVALLQFLVGDVQLVLAQLQLLAVVLVLGVELLDRRVSLLALQLNEGQLLLDLPGVALVLLGELGLVGGALVGGLNLQSIHSPYHFAFFVGDGLLHRCDLSSVELAAFLEQGFVLVGLLTQLLAVDRVDVLDQFPVAVLGLL